MSEELFESQMICPICECGVVKIGVAERYRDGLDEVIAGFETLVEHYRGCIEASGVIKARDFVVQLRRFRETGDPKDAYIFTARGNHLITEIFSNRESR